MDIHFISKIVSLFIFKKNDPSPVIKVVINLLFILTCSVFFLIFIFDKVNYTTHWSLIYDYRQKFINGWLNTVLISSISLALSLSIGMINAFCNQSRIIILNLMSKIYIELIRSTPLLVQILIFFYIIAASVHLNNRFIVGILTLSFFSGAYVSEIFRGGLESISESQLESARSIGLNKFQTYRFVVMPQVIKRILPALAGQFVSLIKDSSLLSVIAISEFTLNAQEVNSFTYSTLESYIPLAIGYFILTIPISLFSRYLERKTKYAS